MYSIVYPVNHNSHVLLLPETEQYDLIGQLLMNTNDICYIDLTSRLVAPPPNFPSERRSISINYERCYGADCIIVY